VTVTRLPAAARPVRTALGLLVLAVVAAVWWRLGLAFVTPGGATVAAVLGATLGCVDGYAEGSPGWSTRRARVVRAASTVLTVTTIRFGVVALCLAFATKAVTALAAEPVLSGR
jgi:hypothetical protein